MGDRAKSTADPIRDSGEQIRLLRLTKDATLWQIEASGTLLTECRALLRKLRAQDRADKPTAAEAVPQTAQICPACDRPAVRATLHTTALTYHRCVNCGHLWNEPAA